MKYSKMTGTYKSNLKWRKRIKNDIKETGINWNGLCILQENAKKRKIIIKLNKILSS